MAPHVDLQTLGSFALVVDGRTAPPLATQKARALVAYLAARRGKPVSRDAVIDRFWPDADAEHGRKNLNTALWSIRKSIRACGIDPDAVIETEKTTLRFCADVRSDVERFELEHDPSVYAGEFLEGDQDEWIVAERERLATLYEAVLIERVLRDGSPEAARALVERDPFQARAYEILIDEEVRRGRPLVAEALLRRASAALSEIDPALARALSERYASLEKHEAAGSVVFRLPFAGRTRELAAFRKLLARDRFAALTIGGIAGAGKSALLEHLARLARDTGREVVAVDAIEDDVRPFGPWERLYERRTGSSFDAFLESAGQTPGVALARAIVGSIAARSLVVVDNTQFLRGDAGPMLSAIARELRERQALLVCATRPEGIDDLRARLPEAEMEWMLGPLTSEDIAAALRTFEGDGFDALATVLDARAEGHALFITQLLDFFQERGALQFARGRWRFDAKSDAVIETPPEVRRFVENRIRACGEDGVLVATALALDTEADADQLALAGGLPPDRAYDALDDLLMRGLIECPEHGPQFGFAHDLIRETAATLLKPQRRVAMHRAFAEIVAGSNLRGASARAARHLVAGRRPLEAVRAYESAIFEALSHNGSLQAEQLSREAIALLDGIVADGDAHERDANTIKRLLSFVLLKRQAPESVVVATEAIRHARAARDRKLELFSYSARAQAYLLTQHDFEKALADLEQLRDISIELGKADSLALTETMLAIVRYCRGEIDESLEACARAYDRAIQLDRNDLAVTAAQYAVRAAASAWRFARANDELAHARETASRFGRIAVALTLQFACCAAYLERRFDDALAVGTEALQMADAMAGERVETTRLHTPADQTAFAAHAIVVVASLQRGDVETAARECDALERRAYAKLNRETRTNVATIRALVAHACGDRAALAAVAPRLEEDALGLDLWCLGTTAPIERALVAEALAEHGAGHRVAAAIDRVIADSAQRPRDLDRVLVRLAAAAGRLGLDSAAERAEAAAKNLAARFDSLLTDAR